MQADRPTVDWWVGATDKQTGMYSVRWLVRTAKQLSVRKEITVLTGDGPSFWNFKSEVAVGWQLVPDKENRPEKQEFIHRKTK